MKSLIMLILILCSWQVLSKGKERIIYKYKKFQEFDLEGLNIKGEVGAPDDLSLGSRFKRKFKNKLPLRRNFNPEIRRSVEVIR